MLQRIITISWLSEFGSEPISIFRPKITISGKIFGKRDPTFSLFVFYSMDSLHCYLYLKQLFSIPRVYIMLYRVVQNSRTLEFFSGLKKMAFLFFSDFGALFFTFRSNLNNYGLIRKLNL